MNIQRYYVSQWIALTIACASYIHATGRGTREQEMLKRAHDAGITMYFSHHNEQSIPCADNISDRYHKDSPYATPLKLNACIQNALNDLLDNENIDLPAHTYASNYCIDLLVAYLHNQSNASSIDNDLNKYMHDVEFNNTEDIPWIERQLLVKDCVYSFWELALRNELDEHFDDFDSTEMQSFLNSCWDQRLFACATKEDVINNIMQDTLECIDIYIWNAYMQSLSLPKPSMFYMLLRKIFN